MYSEQFEEELQLRYKIEGQEETNYSLVTIKEKLYPSNLSTMKAVAILSLIHIIVTATQAFQTIFGRVTFVSRSQLSCICVNCKFVTNCAAYHFVEEKHEQPHISANPTFEPRDGSPTINVHMRPIVGKEEEERRMRLEHKMEEEKAMTNAAASGNGVLIGEKVYDMRPEMSLEYDVVQCEDFVKDVGCWVRNMPEEIRLANPTFVPP